MTKKDYRRIVVKVGSSTLTHAQGGLNLRRIDRLAMVLSDIKNSNHEVILVSSGAVAAGTEKTTAADERETGCCLYRSM